MKHKWQKLDNGEINTFSAYATGGYCNGPVCVECGFSFCEHCNPKGYDTECHGRKGFRIYLADNSWSGYLAGFKWSRKKLFIGFIFFAVIFDFSGEFPFCKEVYSDD